MEERSPREDEEMREGDLRGGLQTTSTLFDWPTVINVGPAPHVSALIGQAGP